ncbi:MAG TPA: methionyl-tRNA formyltransferase [Candidatus Acidoferrum sp.]|jgi:methionyl-tRNA formyltransferase|nr:methionyl-tRNA formyltransferase [Candidatus Acidoferrum sp.]
MRVVFCGTPLFSVPTLKHLLARPDFQIVATITQPDRPRGRGQEVSFSPVKETALAAGIPVHQPEKIRAPEVQELLQKLAPDVIVIIAYGQIIPARLLTIPKLGWVNLHASLLPKYRGAAPINWAIVNSEKKTGVTSMRIDAGMDTGEILLQKEMEIGPAETAPELAARMSELGAPLMVETLRGLAAGTILPRPQAHEHASSAPMLKKEDGRIDWSCPAHEIYNRIRGFAPWPGAYTSFRGQTCHIWGEPSSNDLGEQSASQGRAMVPGSLVVQKNGQKSGQKNEVLVRCGGTTYLRLLSVKLEGRKHVSAAEFVNGAHLLTSEHFGES